MIFTTPVGVVAPIYAGWVYDNNGSYIPAFTLFAALFAISQGYGYRHPTEGINGYSNITISNPASI